MTLRFNARTAAVRATPACASSARTRISCARTCRFYCRACIAFASAFPVRLLRHLPLLSRLLRISPRAYASLAFTLRAPRTAARGCMVCRSAHFLLFWIAAAAFGCAVAARLNRAARFPAVLGFLVTVWF